MQVPLPESFLTIQQVITMRNQFNLMSNVDKLTVLRKFYTISLKESGLGQGID